MLINKLFSIKYFIIGLIIGLIVMIIYPFPTKQIVTYPNEKNNKKVQYVDSVDNCFEFAIKEVDCPANPSEIKIIPIH